MSLTSVDLPDPLTPVTAVSTPSGILTSMFLRLFARAPLMIRSPFIDGRRPFGVGIDFAPVRYAAVSEADALSFAARQRRGAAAERQVADADVVQKTKALLDLLQNPLGDDRLAVGQIQTIEHVERFGHRQIDVLGKRPILHLHRQAFLLQPPPAAHRARTQRSKRLELFLFRPGSAVVAPPEIRNQSFELFSGTEQQNLALFPRQ